MERLIVVLLGWELKLHYITAAVLFQPPTG
jgi:hypothetical protein